MSTSYWIFGAAALAVVFVFTGCTTVGKPMRIKPGPGVPAAVSWYIESKPTNGASPVSCSFVEFDGRGDYIDFEQHTDAWVKVKELADKQKLLLVFYCHGWKNNSQSGDVAEFNEFLSRLSASPAVGPFGYRVHGIFLSWRGNLYHPYVDKKAEDGAYLRTAKQFGEPILNPDHHRAFYWTSWLQEQLSYWSRRNAAEHKVSSVPIARTIYTCASLTKSIDKLKGRDKEGLTEASRVMVMGHSFGALLLERALNATCLDPLTDQWTWFERHSDRDKERIQMGEMALEDKAELKFDANPLPMDFVLLVNSAAPAIYSKAMRDFLTAHRSALRRAKSPYADTPVFISVTSSADSATGRLHPIANIFAPLYPSLRHSYTNLLKVPVVEERRIRQSVFYNRTAGHQPLLVDHWIVEDGKVEDGTATRQDIINHNLNYRTANPLEFLATPANRPKEIKRWKFSLQPADDDKAERKWAKQFGPLEPNRSSYWFVRCNKRLIRNHNDVWSDTAMQLYAALYRLVEWTRIPDNRDQVKPLFDKYWSNSPPSPPIRDRRPG